MSFYKEDVDENSDEYDEYSEFSSVHYTTESTDNSTEYELSFNEGINYVLSEIRMPDQQVRLYTSHAQIIEDTIIRAMSRYDPYFKNAFKGLSLGGSYLDHLKICLPDEFDMHVKIYLGCHLEPVPVQGIPGYVFLRANNEYPHKCIKHFRNGWFVDRIAVQQWFRDIISAVMDEIQYIRISRRYCYTMSYKKQGFGVAHNLVATDTKNSDRQISFDFVPVFEFEAKQFPRTMESVPNKGRTWFAVPRRFSAKWKDDSRSFIVCAPHWERIVLKNKQNLKDSLRLMKRFRDANDMGALVSYKLKSLYLRELTKSRVNWDWPPGEILIKMLFNLLWSLYQKKLPFYLNTKHNLLNEISDRDRYRYISILRSHAGKLASRRKQNYLTSDDMYNIFGIDDQSQCNSEYEDD